MGADERKNMGKRSPRRGGHAKAIGADHLMRVHSTPEGIDVNAAVSDERNNVKSPNPNRSPNQNPTGYTCPKKGCGRFHEFSVYVMAHWLVELVHICDCGQTNFIKRGIARKGR